MAVLRKRRTALYRSSARGAAEPVVANLTQLFVVLAPLPAPDLFVVDRYLAAAAASGLAAATTLVVNKSDLGVEDDAERQARGLPRARRSAHPRCRGPAIRARQSAWVACTWAQIQATSSSSPRP